MTNIERKKFFLDVLDDLRNRCNSNSNYDFVKASGLLRQLLIDGTRLIDIINRDYREKIVFEVTRLTTPSPKIYVGQDGLTYETMISVTFINPSDGSNIEQLNRDQFLKYPIFTFENREVTVQEILKLNANKKGGVHLDKKPNKTIDELMIDMSNSTVNYTGDITGGAYAVHEVGKITLKALKTLEQKVKADIEKK